MKRPFFPLRCALQISVTTLIQTPRDPLKAANQISKCFTYFLAIFYSFLEGLTSQSAV